MAAEGTISNKAAWLPRKGRRKEQGQRSFSPVSWGTLGSGEYINLWLPHGNGCCLLPNFSLGSAVQLLKQETDSEFVFDAELKGENRKLLTRFFGSIGGGGSQHQREWPLLHRKKIEREEVLGTRAPAASSEEDEELSHSLSETRAFLSNT